MTEYGTIKYGSVFSASVFYTSFLIASAFPRPLAPGVGPLESSTTLRTERIAPRLFELTGTEDGNILVYVGERGITLVDAGERTSTPSIRAAVRAISAKPVQTVIITHYHSDHIGGAGWWHRHGATILAHVSVGAQASKDTTIPELQWHRTAAEPEALPTRTFTDSVDFTDGDERISVFHVDSAHTGGDAMVWFHHADVIHMGDVLSTPPGIDASTGGSVDGIIRGLDRALSIAGPRTRIVPGHGPVTDRVFLERYRTMLVGLRDTVESAVTKGWTLDQLLATHPTAGDGPFLGSEHVGPSYLAQIFRARVRRGAAR